jgi:uncharacterized membrane protein
MKALVAGITEAYKELGMDNSNVKFSTHIATVVSSVKNATTYFNTLKEYGVPISIAGLVFIQARHRHT